MCRLEQLQPVPDSEHADRERTWDYAAGGQLTVTGRTAEQVEHPDVA